MGKIQLSVFITLFNILALSPIYAQNPLLDSLDDRTRERNQRLVLGGYGQIDYNQPVGEDTRYNGILDIHRFVGVMGYNFSPRVSLLGEVEIEHVEEVFVEQAFINIKGKDWLGFRGGLLLVPM